MGMSGQKDSWGLPYFIAALLLVGLEYLLLYLGAIPAGSVASVVLSGAELLFGLSCLFIGHFSYPRIQNVRVYSAGYTVGLLVVSHALLTEGLRLLGLLLSVDIPAEPVSFVPGLYFLLIINLYTVSVLPAFMKYARARLVTLLLMAAQAVIIGLLRWPGPVSLWLDAVLVQTPVLVLTLIPSILFAGIVLLNVLSNENHMGLSGLYSGLAVFSAVAWLGPFILRQTSPLDRSFDALDFVVLSVLLVVGSILHSFARMEHRIAYDPLLRIYNRSYCMQIISEQANIQTRPPFTVAMIDIDHFKKVNDTYGHQAGDRVLQHIADLVQKHCIPEGIVCRYGGEEIAVFFSRTDVKTAAAIMDRLRKAVEQNPIVYQSKEIACTISAGLSSRARNYQAIEDVVRVADKALYLAKKSGRNQVRAAKLRDPKAIKKKSAARS